MKRKREGEAPFDPTLFNSKRGKAEAKELTHHCRIYPIDFPIPGFEFDHAVLGYIQRYNHLVTHLTSYNENELYEWFVKNNMVYFLQIAKNILRDNPREIPILCNLFSILVFLKEFQKADKILACLEDAVDAAEMDTDDIYNAFGININFFIDNANDLMEAYNNFQEKLTIG